MIEHAFPEDLLPGGGEGAQDGGDVGPDGLALQPRGAVGPGVLEGSGQLWIGHRAGIDVTDTGHLEPPGNRLPQL